MNSTRTHSSDLANIDVLHRRSVARYGFIHSAGVLQDSMLMNMTWEKFETVFSPPWASTSGHKRVRSKHHAALFLHYALEQNPQKDFRFMWNFSSTSVYGNMGQLNYSGSNSFLDVLTRHRKASISAPKKLRLQARTQGYLPNPLCA